MSGATAADEFKLAFFEAARDLMAADPDTEHVLVTYGWPGTFEPEDLVSFLGVTSEQEAASISRRSRDETLTLEVSISCYRGGGQDMEQVSARRAYQLLRMLDTFARVTDTTVGGTVMWCFLVGHESSGHTDPALIEQGRTNEIVARFSARARIT